MKIETKIKCSNCENVIDISDVVESIVEELKKQNLAQVEEEKKQVSLTNDRQIRQFVHELLTPLAELQYKSEALQHKIGDGKYEVPEILKKYFFNIYNSIFLFKTMILELELASSDKEKKIPLDLELQDVKRILLFAVQLFEESAKFDGITINTKINKLPFLKVDKNKILQVFINLLRNAIYYSNENSNIEILYKETNERIEGNENISWYHEIKFVNWGIGIPIDEKTKIFDLYYRGSNAVKTKPTGSGLGLFLTQRIMRAHGGICIVRNLANPTEISVLFPKEN